MKALVSACGRFVKKEGADGGLEYAGGETRLVSLQPNATYRDVLDSLDRIAGSSINSASSIGIGMVCPCRNLVWCLTYCWHCAKLAVYVSHTSSY